MKFLNLFAATAVAFLLATSAHALSEKDAEIDTALTAKVSLKQAVQAAENTSKGIAIKAETETKDKVTNYEVSVIVDQKINKYLVDPQLGGVTKHKEDQAEDKEMAEALIIRQAKTSLIAAISAAETEGGKAMKAKLEDEHGKKTYKIKVAKGGKTETVLIDPETGKPVTK